MGTQVILRMGRQFRGAINRGFSKIGKRINIVGLFAGLVVELG